MGSNSYLVDYIGKTTKSYNMFGSSNTINLDISTGEKIELDMVITNSIYSIKRDIEEYNLYNKTIPFYLFEMSQEDNYWDFCKYAKKEDAQKIINVKFDFSQNEFKNDDIIIKK